ncbi:hypothetical protein ACN92M_26500 (plasmid) [Paenibacillus polymyxa]|uniref:hypothetical protein n=1 Tax=Paenibacillus polymyxa TaxID=1406 RepID=UPI003B599DA1
MMSMEISKLYTKMIKVNKKISLQRRNPIQILSNLFLMKRENNSYYRISLLRTSLARDVLYFAFGIKEVNRAEITISRGVSGGIQERPFFMAIGMYERGERNPNLETIHIFARFFSVEVDCFLNGMTVNQEKINISYIANQALERASGICELCGGMAPFIRSNGIPYLETYKIKGSSHVAAVCPNCRKKLEILELPGDIIYLQQKINNLGIYEKNQK